MENLIKRWNAKTPTFWKKVQKIAIVSGAIAGVLLALPLSLPIAIVTTAGYVVTVSATIATTAQLTKEDLVEVNQN
jgi:hypothetical protein